MVVTARPDEMLPHVRAAAEAGYDTLVAAGGDGTLLELVNTLATLPHHRFTVGVLPLGTGQDWARTLGIPRKPEAAVRWLAGARPQAVDLGRATIDGTPRLFVNVASAGLSGEVGQRVNRARVKHPWTFLQATIATLLRFRAPAMRAWVDGELFYEGAAFLLAVGNGRFFGRGMQVCPDAIIHDGLLEVVLVEAMGKAEVLAALPTLYRGTHVRRSDVHTRRARQVVVEAGDGPIGIELDGEPLQGRRVEFEVLPGALSLLVKGGGP